MKVAGIIVEYNPLHNGHLHHILETRKISECDYLIAVMSGNFTQRGEVAMIDKFTRTKMALLNHVDLVIELPFVFSVQSADIFAYTSVAILNHLKVDEIYFGSESDNIDELFLLSNILDSEEYNNLVLKYSKEGNSYPTSSNLAVSDLTDSKAYSLPNNILGIHYIRAVKKLKSNIKVCSIKRIETNYFDEFTIGKSIQSATTIRKMIKDKENIEGFVPKNVFNLLKNRKIIDLNMFTEYFKYKIHSSTTTDIKNIFNISEGFENRIKKVKDFSSVTELISQLITRRYTNSKIRRSLIHILCNTQKKMINSFEIPYLRILGMNQDGQEYLNLIKKDLSIPLISKITDKKHPYLEMELRASKIYSMVSDINVFEEEFKPLILMHFD
ncbi:MAG: nucleotidyltransferase [Candidatus Izimaplasma sp.]|nr:nucleotidyltransferase [Candidatus Izimaplasma bacterium]